MGLFDFLKRKKNVALPEEQRKWNKMWELWASGKANFPYAELMTYQSEINNGGHGQYFTNVENTGNLQKELSALEQILSEKSVANLKKAHTAYLALKENDDDEKAEEILEQCDAVFYENEEEINRALEEYSLTIEL